MYEIIKTYNNFRVWEFKRPDWQRFKEKNPNLSVLTETRMIRSGHTIKKEYVIVSNGHVFYCQVE